MNRTEANKEARRRIAEIAEEKNITTCEIQLPGCMRTFGIAPAHRHKRDWYKGDVLLLSLFSQWVAACQPCHDKIEQSRELTEKVFLKLRPDNINL